MGAFRALQRRSGRRRIEQQLDETPLVLDREADEVSLFDRPMRRCDTYLDPRRAVGFIGHR